MDWPFFSSMDLNSGSAIREGRSGFLLKAERILGRKLERMMHPASQICAIFTGSSPHSYFLEAESSRSKPWEKMEAKER